MPDIYLYSGATNPNDIILRDPTVLATATTDTSETSAGGLTRRRWRQIKAAWDAQRAAQKFVERKRKHESKEDLARIAVLELAAMMAAQALNALGLLEPYGIVLEKLNAMTKALRAMAAAETSAATLDKGKIAVSAAKALIAAIAEQEEDEINVIMMLH